jgi:hypothetical protein
MTRRGLRVWSDILVDGRERCFVWEAASLGHLESDSVSGPSNTVSTPRLPQGTSGTYLGGRKEKRNQLRLYSQKRYLHLGMNNTLELHVDIRRPATCKQAHAGRDHVCFFGPLQLICALSMTLCPRQIPPNSTLPLFLLDPCLVRKIVNASRPITTEPVPPVRLAPHFMIPQ